MAGDSHPHDPYATLAHELARSRRYEHPLTLIGISPLHEAAAAEVRRHIRNVDSTWTTHDAIFVLLPESDAVEGHALAARMRTASPLLARSAMRIASFPADALTLEALLEIALGREAPARVRRTIPAMSRTTSAVPSP